MTEAAKILSSFDGAHYMLGLGFSLHPCVRNAKEPLLRKWPALASDDEAQIRAWAAEFENCNWGVVPHLAGCFVLDLDRKNGKDGLAELAKLAEAHGFDIPDTLVVETPSGGLHIYLAGEAANSADKIAPGIDVRGRGGYVLAPGSLINGKPYVVRHL